MRRKRENLSILQLFEHYYHVKSTKELAKAIIEDIITSIFMAAGSGLFTSVIRGFYFKLFMDYKLPAIIGKSFRIINRSKIRIGKVFWAKDNVTLFAGGPMAIGECAVLAERSTIWSGREGMSIGDNFFLGMGSYISALRGKVEIGNDVMIADHVSMYTWNHKFSKAKISYSRMGGEYKDIIIGNNCWLGTGCAVLPGVDLGDNCVVAASTVLTGKKYPADSVIAGVPGKVIRKIK